MNPWSKESRELFDLFLKNGSLSLKLSCLSRLKSLFREPQAGREFKEWAIPLLVNQISTNVRITSAVVDILYENTNDLRGIECLIKHLTKESVGFLTRLEEAKYLVYRLMSVSEGYNLLETQGGYLTALFRNFIVSDY